MSFPSEILFSSAEGEPTRVQRLLAHVNSWILNFLLLLESEKNRI